MPSFLSQLSSLVPSFQGIISQPAPLASARRERPEVSTEKVPHLLYGSRQWILPYGDSTSTDDTPEIRAAMRRMLRDPYVKSAWLTQVLTVLAQDFQVHHPEARKDQRAQDAVDLCRHAIETIEGGLLGLGNAVLMNLGSDGFSLSEKVWDIEDRGKFAGKVTMRALKPKDPDNLNLITDEYRNVTGVHVTRTGETWPISDFTYVRYLHCFDEPMGMAAFRAAYGAYWMRDTVRKLRAIHHEKHASGVWMGTYEDPADKSGLEAALQRVRTAMWAAVPAGVKMEVVQRSTAAEADWKSFDESLREEILLGIAYAHLHILQGGVSDARGNTKVHKEVSDLGPWLLTYLLQYVINHQIFPDICDYNFAGLSEYPTITLGGVTNQEILEGFQILQAAQQAGFKPSRSHYGQSLTIQESDPNDPSDQLTPPQQGGMGGLGGLGGGMGGDPFGGGGGGFGGGGSPAGLPPSDPFGGMGGGDPFASFSEWTAFGWQGANTRTGGIKAIGTGEHAGQVEYGERARALLAGQERTRTPDEPTEPRRTPDRSTFERAASGDAKARKAVEDHVAGKTDDALVELVKAPAMPRAVVDSVTNDLSADLSAIGTDPDSAQIATAFVGQVLADPANSRGVVSRFMGGVLKAGGAATVGVVKALARASWWVARKLGNHTLEWLKSGGDALIGGPARTLARWAPFVGLHLATVAAGAAALGGIALGAPLLPVPFLVKLGLGVAAISAAAGSTRYLAPKVFRKVSGPAYQKAAQEQGIITGYAEYESFAEFDELDVFAEWHPYTNPKTKRQGWISEGGLVRYDDPRPVEEGHARRRQERAETVSRVATAVQDPTRLNPEQLDRLAGDLESLPRDQLRGIARQLRGKLPPDKKALADRILAYVRDNSGGGVGAALARGDAPDRRVGVGEGETPSGTTGSPRDTIMNAVQNAGVGGVVGLGQLRKEFETAHPGESFDRIIEDMANEGLLRPYSDDDPDRALREGGVRASGQDRTWSHVAPGRNAPTPAQTPQSKTDDGPREGDRNAEGLILRDGRWRREDVPVPSATIAPTPIETINAPATPAAGPAPAGPESPRNDQVGTSGGSDGGPVGGATVPAPGAKRVVEGRPGLAPRPNTDLVPEALRQHLNTAQQEGVAASIASMDKHGGHLLADGTGLGKTRQILAVGANYLGKGKKVVVIAPAEVIKPDWTKRTIAGSYADDGKSMGVGTKLIKGDEPLTGGQINVTTYDNLGKIKDKIDKDTVIIFDEAHALKNRDSARFRHGMDAMMKAGPVLYATATPGDKPLHIPYLMKAGVFGGKKSDETYRELGLRQVEYRHPTMPGQTIKTWEVDPKVGHEGVAKRLSGLFDQMTREGLMTQRALSLDGVDVGLDRVSLSPEATADTKAAFDKAMRENGGNKGLALGAARLAHEIHKVPRATSMVKEELAAGRRPIIFLSRVNEDDEDGDSAAVTASELKKSLIAAGVPESDIGELHGAAAKTPAAKKKAMDNFQTGKTKVMIATLQSGGTGVNLDDRTGDAPRTVIMMTPPLSANDLVQAAGRIHRTSTRSAAKVRTIVSDDPIDQWNAALLTRKMANLGAVVRGEVASLDGQDTAPDETPYQWSRLLTRPASPPPPVSTSSATGASPQPQRPKFKRIETRYGVKHLYAAPATNAFWDVWKTKRSRIPEIVSPKKDDRTGKWEVKIWGKTPEETQEAIDQLRKLGVDL